MQNQLFLGGLQSCCGVLSPLWASPWLSVLACCVLLADWSERGGQFQGAGPPHKTSQGGLGRAWPVTACANPATGCAQALLGISFFLKSAALGIMHVGESISEGPGGPQNRPGRLGEGLARDSLR